MNRFAFWLKWLEVMAIIVIIYGLTIAFFSQSFVFDFLLNNQINKTFWETTQVSDSVIMFQKFVYGVIGATAAGWGTVLAFMVFYPYRNKEKWVWKALVSGICIWYFTDTGISLYYYVYSNALINTMLLFAFGIPLVQTRHEFIS